MAVGSSVSGCRRGTEGATSGDDVDILGDGTWRLLSGQFCHEIPGVVF